MEQQQPVVCRQDEKGRLVPLTFDFLRQLATSLDIECVLDGAWIDLDGRIQGTFASTGQGLRAAYETLQKLQRVRQAEEH